MKPDSYLFHSFHPERHPWLLPEGHGPLSLLKGQPSRTPHPHVI